MPFKIENNVTCIPIARQRVGKHIPATHVKATAWLVLLGNGAVNVLRNDRGSGINNNETVCKEIG
jgi:hypothetical protein